MNKKGFTLTEILIVLVVAGVLLALILPNTLKAIERAEVTALRSDLNTVQVSLFLCFTEERAWDSCDSFQELEDGDFLSDQFEAQNNPFGVTYNIETDASSESGAQVACYSGGTVPTDVDQDTSITQCGA